MRIGDFFKRNPSGKEEVPKYNIPTVEASPDLFVVYAEVFRREMATVAGLSRRNVEEMLDVIANGDGGHLNQGRYHKIVFEKYLKERDWSWPEYDRWRGICIDLGKWPVNWPKWDRAGGADGIKKQDAGKVKLELYSILMRTIQFRAGSLHDRKRLEKLGVEKRKIVVTLAEDRDFVDIALAKTPSALTPLFPYDVSFWRAEVPGFS